MSIETLRRLAEDDITVPRVETDFSKFAKSVIAEMEEEQGMPVGDEAEEEEEDQDAASAAGVPHERGTPPMEHHEPDGDEADMLQQLLEQLPALKYMLLQLMGQQGQGMEGGDEEQAGFGGLEGERDPDDPQELLEQAMEGQGSGEAPMENGVGPGEYQGPMKAASLDDDEVRSIVSSLR